MTFAYTYIAIFTLIVLAAGASTIAGRADDDTSNLEHVADLIAAIILWLGMLMFVLNYRNPVVQTIWMVLSVCSALYVIASSWIERRKELEDPGSQLSRPIIAISDIGVCFMLLPAVIINMLFGLASAWQKPN